MTLKHNKKKNSMIVFEQLTSVLTRLASHKQNKEAKFVLGIIKEFYNSKTELGKEKKIFEELLGNVEDEKIAENILTEALNQVKFLDENKLEKEKQALIRKINIELDKNLYNIPLKEFKKYASIQILLNEERNGYKNTTPNERVKIKKEILENLSKKVEPKENLEIDNLTFKVLVNKFNKKYNKLINEDQKEILKGWISYLVNNDEKKFLFLLENKKNKIKFDLTKYKKLEEVCDNETKVLLKESIQKLNDFELLPVEENKVYEIMRFFDICDDFKQAENGANK